MRYIHQHPRWPEFTWDEGALLPLLADVRHQQGHLLGRMKGLGFRFRAEASLDNLTADVVKSSAIEGASLPVDQVRSSIARRLGLDFGGDTPASHDVEGVVEMMLDATQNHAAPLTADRLCGWQAALFPAGRSGLRRVLAGRWRTAELDPMQVVSGPISRDRIRRKNIHFEAPAAGRLPREVAAFLKWFEGRDGADPVLRAGVAHFWFVTLHPFEDGNGRVSRAIADMALARAEASTARFYSMSTQIEADKQAYYLTLEKTQKGDMDITGWLKWFLECLERAVQGAENSLAVVLRKSATWERINGHFRVNDRQRAVVNQLLDGPEPELSTSRYAKLADCSLDTALRDITDLVEAGILLRGSSGGRSTKYSLAS